MNRVVTKGIVLSRTDYGESDRVLKVLTSDQGKVGIMAKGVRKQASKMAGGIELFNVNEISFINSRGQLKTLVSSRLVTQNHRITQAIERTMLGYELLRIINKTIEDDCGQEYFDLASTTLAGLNDLAQDLELVELWFLLRLLKITGSIPDFSENEELRSQGNIGFDFETMRFDAQPNGIYTNDHIKFMRIAVASKTPSVLCKIKQAQVLIHDSLSLAKKIKQEQM